MAIPLSQTTVTIMRVYPDPSIVGLADGYAPNPPAARVVQTGVRAVLPPPNDSSRLVGGDRIVKNLQMQCDPCDLEAEDTVTDELNGTVWTVLWVNEIRSFGFCHTTAGLRLVTGAAP